jgi:penicillin-binding protein 2
MIEVKDTGREIKQLRIRLSLAMALIFMCFGILLARFAYLQIYRYSDFHAQAEDNRISLVPVPPSRGLIFDRNGILLAENVSAFTLELTPKDIADLDGLIDQLASIVDITPKDRRRFKRLLEDSRTTDSIPLKVRLSDEEVAKLAVQRYRFKGVDIKARQFRNYPFGETGAHLLGYIGRISPDEKKKLEDSDNAANYAGSSHIGKVGLELSYQGLLLGQAGSEEVEVSAGGRVVRSLSKTPARAGANLHLSIDIKLQKLIEEWFGERKGALVAIDPKTGDIVAFVSKPTFDPNLFVDGIDTQTWAALNEDMNKPMLNRALRGTYPPGSTYKPFMAMAALETGARTVDSSIFDPGYFALGSHRFRDSKPSGHGTVDMKKSIVVSSDTFYYKTAYDMGVDAIHDYMVPFGFGQITGVDLDNEVTGILPSTAWKMKRYKQKWLPGETPSIGIGQGYNTFTMLQLAHATGILANNGVAMRPHLVKYVEDPVTRQQTTLAKETHRMVFKPEHIELVRSAMVEVNRVGTGRVAFTGAEYVAAGKTGTAQVIGIKQGERYDAKKIEERFRDHSLFMSFAPADSPRLAVAVIVENGGFGAQAAAPIVRKVFDYFLLGKLPKDQAPMVMPRGSEEADLRDVPESMEPEPISAAEAAKP